MTAKEALEYFKRRKEQTELNDRVQQAEDLAIKALEKQIPKKPKNEYTDNLDITTEIPVCPVCGDQSIYETDEYCSDCGQRLDWSETK